VTYRWTGPDVPLARPTFSPSSLHVRWNGWRPAGWPPARVRVFTTHCGSDTCFDTETVFNVPNDTAWHDVEIGLSPATVVSVVLHINTFVPGGYDPRALGLKIDRIEWK
jgi:hypothetical protein